MALFAQHALLAQGWTNNVRLTVDRGCISQLELGVVAAASDERVDTVIPGLCNAHSHAFQRALAGHTERRGVDPTDTFWTWRALMYRLADRVGPDELHGIARQLYTEMVASGYTSVVEFHYLHRAENGSLPSDAMFKALLSAANDSGIRLIYAPILFERADFDQPQVAAGQRGFHLTLKQYLAHVDAVHGQLEASHSIALGAHSLRTVTAQSLSVLAAEAERLSAPLHLHIAEQPREVEHCIKHYGARPVRWLLDQYEVNARWTLVHATHLDDDECQRLAASSAVVCLCPSTEGNLGDGLFGLTPYLNAAGSISIGSDSHVSVNPFEELRWLEYGQRLALKQRNVAARDSQGCGERLYLAALAGGAQSAGVSAAGLQEGAEADLLVLDRASPTLAGHGNESLLDALVFSGQPLPIHKVMIDGRWVVDNGAHPSASSAAIEYAAVHGRLDLASGSLG